MSDHSMAHAGAHPSAPVLDLYLRQGLGVPALAAVEIHVGVCPLCRFALNEQSTRAQAARIDVNLLAITAELDAPRPGVVERVVRRAGFGVDTARLLVATPSLRRSWFIAIGIALLFGIAAASPDRPDATLVWFLGLAPLIPVVGVSLAYGPGVDPSYEMSLAAPISGFRLLLIRSGAVLTTSVGVVGLLSLLMLNRHSAMVGAWLIPALSLSSVCLALMSVLSPRRAAAIVCGAWLVLVVITSGGGDQLALFRSAGQLGVAVTGGIAAIALAVRRRSFDVAGQGFD